MIVCQNGHEDIAQLYISSSDIDLNARDKEGRTAFMFACSGAGEYATERVQRISRTQLSCVKVAPS